MAGLRRRVARGAWLTGLLFWTIAVASLASIALLMFCQEAALVSASSIGEADPLYRAELIAERQLDAWVTFALATTVALFLLWFARIAAP